MDAAVYSTWNKASGRVLQTAGFAWEGVQRRQIWREGRESDLDIWVMFREGGSREGLVEVPKGRVRAESPLSLPGEKARHNSFWGWFCCSTIHPRFSWAM